MRPLRPYGDWSVQDAKTPPRLAGRGALWAWVVGAIMAHFLTHCQLIPRDSLCLRVPGDTQAVLPLAEEYLAAP